MSTAIFDVTVLELEVGIDNARLRIRCAPIASEGDRAVTRSFVIRLLAADNDLATTGAPPALVEAVREAGLEPWPDTPAEAQRLHAPVIDRLVTSTRVIAEHSDDSYELEAVLPDPRFVKGLHVGQTFPTYASDVWFDDPKHPLASEADRARWAKAQQATISSLQQEARAGVDREAERITTWLERAEADNLFAVAGGKHARVAKRVAKLIVDAGDPFEAATAVVEYLMDSDDIEEVFAEDAELRRSIASALTS